MEKKYSSIRITRFSPEGKQTSTLPFGNLLAIRGMSVFIIINI